MNRIGDVTVAFLALLLVGCGARDAQAPSFSDEHEPCADRNPLRNLYFGDLHVHTAYSFDAYLSRVRTTPQDAYRFARGEPIEVPDVAGTKTVQLRRPLDFAAVTDHAEYLGEISACTRKGSAVYESSLCQEIRENTEQMFLRFGNSLTKDPPSRYPELCEEIDCLQEAREAWVREQAAADGAWDRTAACSFTTLVGYEWSASPGASNMHRNVIFRTADVPELPTSYIEQPEPEGLWTRLQEDCLQAPGDCDVLAIPHNSNWSNGNMFHVEYPDDADPAEAATRRAALEPLVEIYQHKGDSECKNGLSGILGEPDELCTFEKLRPPPFEDCGDGTGQGAMVGRGCLSRLDFVRGALLEGLREQERIGVNPYRLGIIASTDTHNGTPGSVDERSYGGHFGRREASVEDRLAVPGISPEGIRNSPGGLVAVWAEENSRSAIFDSLRRREVYGTSGPRIAVRVFAGWDMPEDLCTRGDLVEVADDRGVPMGASLPEPPSEPAAPMLVMSATMDPGTDEQPGTPLQRLQVIKGWLDAQGQPHVRVIDVAGDDTAAEPDPSTCTPPAEGPRDLCAVWRDPAYDGDRPGFYYVRVLEQPSCRWSAHACLRLDPDARPETCEDDTVPTLIQERAWTSPIWY